MFTSSDEEEDDEGVVNAVAGRKMKWRSGGEREGREEEIDF